MPQDFSYERDVQAYIPRFFAEMRQDPKLSPQSVERLQTGVLKSAQDIELQRMKLKEERDQSLLRKLSAEQTMLHLDNFRRRQRREEQEAAEAETVSRDIGGVVNSDLSDYEKRARIRDLTLSHLGTASKNSAVRWMLETTQNALPEPKNTFTPAQQIEFYKAGLTPEIVQTGDPDIIGTAVWEASQYKEAQEARAKAIMERVEKDEEESRKLLQTPIKFQKPDPDAADQKPRWLEDESQITAKVIVEKWGTPEEKKEFCASNDNDPDRARIANDVRFRLLVGGGGKEDKRETVRQRFFR